MLAGLPMYEFEAVRPAFDRLWQGLARAFEDVGLCDVPARLDRALAPEDLWGHPDLLIAQTCGYPLTHALRDRVQLVATACYAAPVCEGPLYASLIMIRSDDERRRLEDFRSAGKVAINSLASHSGHHALRATLAAHGAGRWFEAVTLTGGHGASLDAVRAGRADLAAIDGVTVALLRRHAAHRLAGLRALEISPSAPGLPFITSLRTSRRDLDRLRAGLKAAMVDPALERVRRDLLIADVRVLPFGAYRRIVEIERVGTKVELPEIQDDPHEVCCEATLASDPRGSRKRANQGDGTGR